MIDPASITTESSRRAQTSLPTKVRSETTISYKPPDLSSMSEDSDSEDEDDGSGSSLTMSPVDIRVIRRLSSRANVLPVVARADSLTDGKLAAIKKVIRRDLRNANLDFGVFGPVADDPKSPVEEHPAANGNGNGHNHTESSDSSVHSNGNGNGNGNANGSTPQAEEQQPPADAHAEEAEPERPSRPVIKLRPTRLTRRPSRSRSRLEITELSPSDDPSQEIVNDTESVASVRFSAHIVAKTDLSTTLPFALITPEHTHRRRALKNAVSPASVNGHGHAYAYGHASPSQDDHASHRDSMIAPSEDGHAQSIAQSSMITSPVSPSTPASLRHFPYLQGPPADLKGVFVRKFRWGTVDVLNPEHCDFAALRTAILSTHIKVCGVWLPPSSSVLTCLLIIPSPPDVNADAQNPDEGGVVREVQDGEAARPPRDTQHQRGRDPAAVGRCVVSCRSMRLFASV